MQLDLSGLSYVRQHTDPLDLSVMTVTRRHGKESYDPIFDEGYEALQANQLDKAAACFYKMIKINPDSVRGFFGLAKVELMGGNIGRARIIFEQFRTRYPEYTEKAVACCDSMQQALAEGGWGSDPMYYLTVTMREIGEPTYSHYFNEGNLAVGKGDVQKAKIAYKKMLEINPKSTNALIGLGKVALLEFDKKLALEFFARAALKNGSQGLRLPDGLTIKVHVPFQCY